MYVRWNTMSINTREGWDIAYKLKFLIRSTRTILVPCDIQVDILPPRDSSGKLYSNHPLAVKPCVKRCPIPWTLNLGCAKSLELATENETPIKAKKQASEGTPFLCFIYPHYDYPFGFF